MTRSARIPLAGAALATLGVALGRLLAFRVGALHHADALTLHGFMSLDRPSVHSIANGIAHIADPAPYGVLGLLLIALAIMRGRPRVAAAVAVVLLGAAVTTDYILKPLLAAPRYASELGFRQVPSGSFPSGHATASMALALCAILVASPRLRPLVAVLGAAFAIAVSFAFLALGWHYPSDVLGGYLVATTWTMAAIAGLSTLELRRPRPVAEDAAGEPSVGASLVPQGLVLAGAAAVACLLSLARPHTVLAYVGDHLLFVAGAAAIGVLALMLAGVITLSARR
jgi:membrane-associated phospholipid phosphatase